MEVARLRVQPRRRLAIQTLLRPLQQQIQQQIQQRTRSPIARRPVRRQRRLLPNLLESKPLHVFYA